MTLATLATLLTLALAGGCLGCVSGYALGSRLAAAAQPGHLPLVVACWEKQVEEAGGVGDYEVTVDLVVEGETSRLRDAKVTEVKPGDAGGEALAACVEDALSRSALPREADKDGPGFAHGADVQVRGYRIAFIGPSTEDRARAEARQAHVLLGPRTDRCQGLYRYAPPRDASALSTALAEAEARASALAESDRDQHARELQKAYDVLLELRERLRLDAAEPGLPQANRRRVLQALDEAEKDARRIGALIGCKP